MKKISLLLLISFTLSACSLGNNNTGVFDAGATSVEMWVVVDSPTDYSALIDLYHEQYPNIPVVVKKVRLDNYEEELLNALAEDRGPDIFMIHNTWIRKYLSKIEPLPSQITLPQAITTGAIKKEIVIREETTASITPLDVQNKFVDVVADDVIVNNQIYGLPLYVDSLVLYYNKDLLNNAGIAQPPLFWDQYQTASSKLTRVNAKNEIIQAGSALGTSNNIENAADILALLMIQNGAEMTTETKTAASFNKNPQSGAATNPAAEALRFYTDFALPQTTAYSWNAKQPNNLEAFTSGQLAFFFGYAYHYPLIKSQTLGKLNVGVSPMLQIQNRPPANIANYWLPVVSNKSKSSAAAWSFIQFIAGPDRAPLYLDAVKKPAALRELVNTQSSDPDLFAHAGQALNAQNWFYGIDATEAREAMNDMIDEALLIDPDTDRLQGLLRIISRGVASVNQAYQ